jgi:DNA-binding response OmpR family regulator
MQLNILLVEDEPGIRDGLASFLRFKGMRVTTAGSRQEGLSALARDDHDVVVTDWRLGDGLGADIVAASQVPVVIASGVPEEVDPLRAENVCVVRKPIVPAELVDRIEELARPRTEAQATAEPDLPTDARDRIRLLLALAGDPDPESTQVIDDGSFVSLEARLTGSQEAELLACMPLVERICGDVRILGNGRPLLQARFYRDSRGDEAVCILSPSETWPRESTALAIDFDSAQCSPARFRDLVRQARESEQKGRSVAFLNVPGHLRLYLEVLGEAHDMPKRERAGPRLPEVLTELWR